MSFLKHIVNERKENREREEFISRVHEEYGQSKEILAEAYDKAIAETNSKVIAKAKVFSAAIVTEEEAETWGVWDRHDKKWVGSTYKSKRLARARVDRLDNEYGGYRYTAKPRGVNEDSDEEPHIESAKDIIDLILPEYMQALDRIDQDMSTHGDSQTTPWEEFTALIRYYGLIPAMKKLRLNPQDLHDELDEIAWSKLQKMGDEQQTESTGEYDPSMDQDPEDTWQYDYATDTGWSARCPNCGSDEVMYDDHPKKQAVQRFACQNCGATGPWMR